MNIGWGMVISAAALALLGSPAARAGDVVGQINDDAGHPVTDAVISLKPADDTVLAAAPPALWDSLRRSVIDQRDETFIPYVVIVGRGGSVVFHNSDTPHHHVYSFSPIKSFEFVMTPGTDSEPVVFDKPGVAAIGCNIHDQMIAYVYVSDTPWVVLTDKSGQAHLSGLPSGAFTATIWHPMLRPGRPLPSQQITVGDAPATLTATLSLLSAKHRDREHGLY